MTRTLMALVLFLVALPLQADRTFDDFYKATASWQGLDWRLVKAIAIVESNERPNAVHTASQSIGLMQVLCRDDGRGGCANRLNNIIGWPVANRGVLLNPNYNIIIGTQILAWNIRTYGQRKGIAAYNQWSARKTPRGVPFPNQQYVDKVLRTYHQLKTLSN